MPYNGMTKSKKSMGGKSTGRKKSKNSSGSPGNSAKAKRSMRGVKK